MTFSVLKRSTAACWVALNVMFKIFVIGPACVISLGLLVMALPSPGAFYLSQAEDLIRGAEAGKVWGCEPAAITPLADEAASVSQAPPMPTLCTPKQESQTDFVAGFNRELFTFYKVIMPLYALFYFSGYLTRRKARSQHHAVWALRSRPATAQVKEVHHE